MANISSWLNSTSPKRTKIPLVTALFTSPRICKRAKPDLIQIRLHVQQKPASGHKIDLQNMVRQRCDGSEILSIQMCALLSAKIKIHCTN